METTDTRTLVVDQSGGLTAAGFVLEVEEGGLRGPHLSAGGEMRVGSARGNHVVLTTKDTSRYHFQITVDDKGASIEDLGSTNGTFIDGLRIERAYLRHGATIVAGTARVRFYWRGERRVVPLTESSNFGEMVGQSLAMRRTFATLALAAASDSTVLLRGETGTGKEESARAIHARSRRNRGPFEVVDLGALPATLAESVLFGHERGAFTGADRRHEGAFERANGGTLFLDELGETPVAIQPKLLRAIETRSIQRVGGHEVIKLDVRLVAGTHRDLRMDVNHGRFREDLYYRLAVIEIVLPSLRERPEDLVMVASHLLAKMGAAKDEVLAVLTPDRIARWSRAAWPGNVRELRNVIERLLVLGDDEGPSTASQTRGAAVPLSADRDGWDYAAARRSALATFERSFVVALLDAHGGNVTHAARSAGMTRAYLHRLIQRANEAVAEGASDL